MNIIKNLYCITWFLNYVSPAYIIFRNQSVNLLCEIALIYNVWSRCSLWQLLIWGKSAWSWCRQNKSLTLPLTLCLPYNLYCVVYCSVYFMYSVLNNVLYCVLSTVLYSVISTILYSVLSGVVYVVQGQIQGEGAGVPSHPPYGFKGVRRTPLRL